MTPQLHELFQCFWQIYPRRVAKLDAMKAFDKALKIAPAADIIAGARRYAAIQREPQFTAFPATWLRAGRWMDEAEALPPLTGMAALEAELRNEIDDHQQRRISAQGDHPKAVQALSLFGWEEDRRTSRTH